MKRIVVDSDGTLTHEDPATGYADKAPSIDMIARLRSYRDAGFEIIVMTARNMRTYNGSVGKINAFTLPRHRGMAGPPRGAVRRDPCRQAVVRHGRLLRQRPRNTARRVPPA